MLALAILVASTVIGCGGGTPCPSTLTILSVTEGEVLVMKEGTQDWVPAQEQMELDVGDGVKTGGNSSAEITFFDGSTMELGAGTEIEILSLDIVCSTGVTIITLAQMIGDTISRVTAILDPASTYEVETPSGVAGVRGTRMEIRVFRDNWSYVDGTALVTNWEGSVYVIAQGVELDVPEGERCLMILGQEPNLMPVANNDTAVTDENTLVVIPVLDNDYDPDVGDTLVVDSVTQGSDGDVEIVDDCSVGYSPNQDFNGIDSFNYTVSDGKGGTDTATVQVTVGTSAAIEVKVVVGWSAAIFILDNTLDAWAIDKATGNPVDGSHHVTDATITVAGEHDYCVWVYVFNEEYAVTDYPEGWVVQLNEEYYTWEACGTLAADSLVLVSFAQVGIG
jgi:hypothetical protein